MTAFNLFNKERAAERSHACCNKCGLQFLVAEREISAFVKGIDLLFGKAESLRAKECWLTLAENTDVPLIDGYPVWSELTIQAAVRFASTLANVADQRRSKEEISVP